MDIKEFREACSQAAEDMKASRKRQYELSISAVEVLIASGELFMTMDVYNALVEFYNQLCKEVKEEFGITIEHENNEG